jgi:ABC-type multidrug transport system fused ATPase/permease subunit
MNDTGIGNIALPKVKEEGLALMALSRFEYAVVSFVWISQLVCSNSLNFSFARRVSQVSLTMSSSTQANNSQFQVLGVCGGIGSGKSSACQLLVSALGCIAHLGEFRYSLSVERSLSREANISLQMRIP